MEEEQKLLVSSCERPTSGNHTSPMPGHCPSSNILQEAKLQMKIRKIALTHLMRMRRVKRKNKTEQLFERFILEAHDSKKTAKGQWRISQANVEKTPNRSNASKPRSTSEIIL